MRHVRIAGLTMVSTWPRLLVTWVILGTAFTSALEAAMNPASWVLLVSSLALGAAMGFATPTPAEARNQLIQLREQQMSTTAWHLEPLACFDTETTGINVEADRIVTATVGLVKPGAYEPSDVRSWLIAVDVDIPPEAEAVHGIGTLQARERGEPPTVVLEAIAAALTRAMMVHIPVVACNAVYDFTILDRELRRNGLPTMDQRLHRPIGPVIDVLVLDKALDPYRKGGRKLTDLCAHYGIPIDGAHDSTVDALAAARVAYRMAWLGHSTPTDRANIRRERQYPALQRLHDGRIAEAYQRLAGMTLTDLHDAQVRWRREQSDGLRRYFDERCIAHDGVPGDWPMIPDVGRQVRT